MTSSVGVIGLGVIGKPIAERLVKAGFRVAV
jgi:3-hydroxyisobutyrate dehydrogenase-like beta-hydroxyacid dehydrogenase